MALRAGARLREPLIWFGLLVVLVFALWFWRAPNLDERRIAIGAKERTLLRENARRELGREPSEKELSLALERWKLDEIAYREGLRLGLDRSNAQAREIVVTAFKDRLLATASATAPTSAELDRFLAEHRDAYVEPVRYDFDTVGSPEGPSEEAAWRVFDALVKAPEPVSLPAEAERHEAQSFKQVAQAFGAPFAQALDRSVERRFQLVASSHGWVVLRLVRKTGGSLPPRELLTPRLIEAVRAEQRHVLAEAALRERAKIYEISEE